MPSLSFYLRKEKTRLDLKGQGEIVLIYHHDKKQTFLKTGHKIAPEHWNNKSVNTWVRASYGDAAVSKNLALKTVMANAEKLLNNYMAQNDGAAPTVDEIRQLFLGKKAQPAKQQDFFTLYNQFMRYQSTQRGNKNVSVGTYDNYRQLQARLEDFSRYEKISFGFHSIDETFADRFSSYLTVEHENEPSTIAQRFKTLKTFLKWARIHHEISISDRIIATIRSDSTQHPFVYLTEPEMASIRKLDLSRDKQKDLVRDAFILLCETGLRHSDLSSLSADNIVRDGATVFIHKQSVKTEVNLTIPLSSTALAILKKYNGLSPKDWVPPLSPFNVAIKEVCRLAGITDRSIVTYGTGNYRQERILHKYQLVSSHTGRRSYITRLANLQVPDHVICSLTGQSKATMQNYKQTTNFDRVEAVKKMEQFAPASPEPMERVQVAE